MRYKILLFLMLAFSSGQLFSQGIPDEITLSGTITEQGSQRPLQGATIYVEELERGTAADEDGFYTITLPPGTYSIRFQFLGMRTKTVEVDLRESQQLDAELAELEMGLDEIIVQGTGFWDNLRGVVTGVEVVTIRDLEQLPQLMGEVDVIQSLTMLPGVQTVGEGASGFNVRGGREDQNLVMMHGAPLFNSSHVLGLFSVFNPDATDSYALYKGHMPERYGGRLSSVLDVSMRNGSFEDYTFGGGLGLYSGRFIAEGPIIKNRTSFLIAGRGADSGIVFNLAGKNRDLARTSLPLEIYNSNARFYDGNATLTHRINNNHSLALSLYGSYDLFQYSDEFGYSWNTRIASLNWTGTFSENLFSDFSAVTNSYRSNWFTPSGPDAFRLGTGIRYLNLKETITYTGLERAAIYAGAEWIRYSGDDETIEPFNELSAVDFSQVNKDTGREMAIFAGNEIELTDRLLVQAGVRFSFYNQLGPGTKFRYSDDQPRSVSSITDSTQFSSGEKMVDYSGFEPRLSSRLILTDNSSVKLSYNRTRQYIHQISNSASPTPADIWQMSTSHLPPQKAHNYSIGYYQNIFGQNLETSVEFYYRNIENLVEYIDFADLFLNSQIETELITGRGRNFGSELSVRATGGRWTGWISYSYSRSLVQVKSEFPESQINSGEWYPSNHDQPHHLNLIAVRNMGENSAFSFNFTWNTGRPFTAISSNYIDGSTTVPVFSDRNELRTPDYIRLDISFTIADNIWKNRTVNPDRRISDSANFTLYNILGRKNAFSVFYQRRPSASVPASYKLSVLGAVIPSFTYNFNF
ncbi:MAG: TonB-dependent receptor [Balneolaceae bacterium]|nr:MAG: TonB-dependent receptor [Balneolaceae bacterium]